MNFVAEQNSSRVYSFREGEEEIYVARQAICIFVPVKTLLYGDLYSVGHYIRDYYLQQQKEPFCLSALVLWHGICSSPLDFIASKT